MASRHANTGRGSTVKALFDWFAYRLPIRSKLMISFYIMIMVPILVLGLYSYRQSRDNNEQQIRSTMESNLSLMTAELDAQFERENAIVRLLAYNLNFRRALESSGGIASSIAREMNNTVEPIFWYFIAGDSAIKRMAVYSPLVSREIGTFLIPADESILQEKWYLEAMENYATIWRYDEDGISATRAILDTDSSSKMIAVLRLYCHPATLMSAADSVDYLSGGICIADDTGQLVYVRRSGTADLDEAVRTLAETGEETAALREGLLYTGQMHSSGWTIYYYVDRANITEMLRPILYTMLFMIIICLILVTVLSNWLATVLTSRILRLQEYAGYVAEGHLDRPLSTTDTDEIGVVTNSMGHMAERLNTTIHQVYQMEIAQKASELRALQAMINPHFLYNCLSNIKWKAIRSGNDDIDEITGLLARFYRTCLNKGQALTTVGTELENIRAYIRIQQLTHDNEFDAEYDIDESQLGYTMLNFMLQPIVENAIKHGLEEAESGERGHVLVECRGEGDAIVFRIINNCSTIDINKVTEVMSRPGKGYGIYNICERIRLYYGEGSSLTPSITDDGRTCFTLRLARELRNVVN